MSRTIAAVLVTVTAAAGIILPTSGAEARKCMAPYHTSVVLPGC
jgi:hypothetical protein